jgi:hypothetical protein|tara:strand:+ start:271 stop:444 length:174 start_codon:yes stop_codon:yes gene_type:complete
VAQPPDQLKRVVRAPSIDERDEERVENRLRGMHRGVQRCAARGQGAVELAATYSSND